MNPLPHSQLHFTRVAALDLELLHTRHVTHDYPPHLHEEVSLGVMLDGREAIESGGATYHATAGSVLTINAEEVHANRSVRAEYRVMKVRAEVLCGIAAEIGGRGAAVRFPRPVVHDAAAFRALQQLFRTFDRRAAQLEVQSAFVAAMGLLLARCGNLPVRASTGTIESVREYLKAHYADDISLAELTRVAGLSPFHLLRLFRRDAGVPPHEYQTQVRIAHARKLIRDGLPLADAALQTGFFDQSHLTRSFKRIVGMTPGRYLAQSKIVQDLSPAR